MDEPMHVMYSTLELVYPPVSNQEADWVKADPDVQDRLRRSDFYLIGARAEATFGECAMDDTKGQVVVSLSIGDSLSDQVILDPYALAECTLGYVPEKINFSMGSKFLKFEAVQEDSATEAEDVLIAWFTTEKLIFERSRGMVGIAGLDRYREFATYDLLYVGIAKSTDTFDRLFAGTHHARQKILTNEWPRRPASRVTDELVLFALRVEPMTIRDVSNVDGFGLFRDGDWDAHCKTVVVDAEKAFVHLLGPQYNVEKFASYPRSKDGLYGYGYQRYSFVIAENLTFQTAAHTLRGSRGPDVPDMLSVSGDVVQLWTGQG